MAGVQLTDEEAQFRKRARRRLVGAVALVLLMVTVLPMVLDDQQAKEPQPEIAISIPSQDANDFASKIVPVVPSVPGDSPKTLPSASVPDQSSAPSGEAITAPLQKSAENPNKAASRSTDENLLPEAKHLPRLAAKSETGAAKSVNVKGTFSVQIGVFADASKVKTLQEKLLTLGVKTYTENLATPNGNRIRLRSGPYPTRSDAEAVRDKLKAVNIAAMVVVNK